MKADPRSTDPPIADSSVTDSPVTDPTAAYVAPLAVYLVGVSLAASLPDAYPVAYAGVVVLTVAAVLWAWRRVSVIRPHRRVVPGVACGLVGIALWIGLSELGVEAALAAALPESIRPPERVGFDPWRELGGGLATWAFVAARLTGLVLLIPIAEELFWRGFLLRWTIAEDWRAVSLGTYRLQSFLIVTALFTLVHSEWVAAAIYAMLLNGLLYWRKDLWQCVVAHGVSNAVLAAYVISASAWYLW